MLKSIVKCTRSLTGKSKHKVYLVYSEPTTFKKVMASPEWLHAMKSKYDSLLKNGTWDLTKYHLKEKP